MKRIGITGSIGSGKSTVSSLLRTRGFTVLDADAVAHEVSSQPDTLLEVARAFGPEYVSEHGLNRPLLAERVFSGEVQLERLNHIIHPKVRAHMIQLEREVSGLAVFHDIPLLFESGLETGFDATVMVDAPVELRLERVRQRSHLSDEQFLARDAAQMSPQEKRARANCVLHNDRDLATLEARLDGILEQLDLSVSSRLNMDDTDSD